MKIFIKYFGLIKDITHLNEEVFEIKNNMSVLQFIQENLYSKYSELSEIDFRIAINNNLCENNHQINNEDHLSLLPFFSGG